MIIKDVQMKNNICILKLRAPSQDCVQSLLQDYRSGNLGELASLFLVSDEHLGCYGVSRSDIILAVSIQTLRDCYTPKIAQGKLAAMSPNAHTFLDIYFIFLRL